MTTTSVPTGLDAPLMPKIDDLDRVAAGLRTIARRVAALNAEPAPPAPGSVAATALLGDGTLPEDLGERVYAAEHRAEISGAELGELIAARAVLEQHSATVKAAFADDVLRGLHDRLGEVVARTRQLEPDLTGVTSAEGAIAAGPKAVAAWGELTGLVKRHDQIRAAQREWTRHATGADPYEVRTAIERYGTVADPETATDLPPAGPALLRWLAQDGVEPWVPDSRQLDEVQRRVTEAAREAQQARADERSGRATVHRANQAARREHARDMAQTTFAQVVRQ